MFIFFNIPEARDFLIKNGYVYTIRKTYRHIGKEIAVTGSWYKHTKISEVIVERILRSPLSLAQLDPYVKDSGFKTSEEWWSKVTIMGDLYKVTMTSRLLPFMEAC